MTHTPLPEDEAARRRAGLLLGTASYVFWGFMPLFFALAAPASSLEILAHRIVWSLVFCLILLTGARGFGRVLAAVRSPRLLGTLALASAIVACNWFAFLYGVEVNRVLEISLGYFINPLVTIALGVIFLHERLRPLQWAAVGLGAAAVVVIAAGYGHMPWLSLAVAFSFGTYGLVKNRVGGRVGALEGLTIETAVLTPPALVVIGVLAATGHSHFGSAGLGHAGIMMLLGPLTAIPLIMFSGATRRVPLSWVGMLQYIAPTMQFVLGTLVFHEAMSTTRWIGFIIIWATVGLIIADMLRASRRGRRR
ncbi:EamA family transporter RarD [Brevibacterium sp. BRM-1]|uniref:EamA family transporter RarD n=1 Tax=Brevibacterium sp. BRM-1 TaxID=2999062 RepID=UPI0022816BDD|nr:EamA family transporter RarD [Brevibacterium sp. BRM-1]WAL41551.1 EamA family transporter RarD [Brevibacterium sp. BRM-1]